MPEEEATGLVFGAIIIVNSLEKMREEKARTFSWVLQFWMQRSMKKKIV